MGGGYERIMANTSAIRATGGPGHLPIISWLLNKTPTKTKKPNLKHWSMFWENRSGEWAFSKKKDQTEGVTEPDRKSNRTRQRERRD